MPEKTSPTDVVTAPTIPCVDGEDLEWEGQLQTWNDEPFTGIQVWRYPNDVIESETTYKNGLTDGPARTWDEQGHLRSEFSCRLGALHGNRKKWHANGQLAEDANFEWGVMLDAREYDEQGALTREFRMDPKDADSQYSILLKFREACDTYLDERA